jgi:zinc protease
VSSEPGSGQALGTPQESLKHDLSAATVVIAERPTAPRPREYRFPRFARFALGNGLRARAAQLDGRRLVSVRLVVEGGAAEEPAELAGITSIVASGLLGGTHGKPAPRFLEEAETLGAELQAEAGWHVLTASLEVPRTELPSALALLAEMVGEPAFPDREVERLRGERVNDLAQARGDPKRRADLVFNEAIYAPGAAYGRPLNGTRTSLEAITSEAVRARHAKIARPERAAIVMAGDFSGYDLETELERSFGSWRAADPPGQAEDGAGAASVASDAHNSAPPRVLIVDRPGSPQTELRIGHVGLSRSTVDYHAVMVMNAILGGLFNSRLQQRLRDDRGYTYGVTSSFELRRRAGPFAVRTAVQADATAAAVDDALRQIEQIRTQPVTEPELSGARQFLVGTFPLRFAVSDQVSAGIAELVALQLPDDEFDNYCPGLEAVTAGDVQAAAGHIRPDSATIVAVGDARKASGLRDLLGEIAVVGDDESGERGGVSSDGRGAISGRGAKPPTPSY